MEDRKMRGLCFNCDEKFVPGHKCKNVFTIVGVEEEPDEWEGLEQLEEVPEGVEEETLGISLTALTGQSTANTLKVKGKVKNNYLKMLLDTWSTHSFLDPQTTRQLGCEVIYTNNLLVTVANGNQMDCNAKCPAFQWEMGKHHFIFEMRLLKLGGCDAVIGVDFMQKFGPVLFDHVNQFVTLRHGIKDITIHADKQEGSISMITGQMLSKMFKKGQVGLGCFFMMSGE
ncbi:PREDICTED: uncharacterized protein LOC105969713 [Erythranthe guttata]|uniref:uncharacterized protein LOC105969713 n=1 Tax=Erythranthe guttata TaxID=4155 RepID=UPI00064DC115|nr:PREDICTED: uncharacterized protein LOC105969713 [Erythranthe guttata]|eukprot:XP_012849939.1 PREDICTED: uncharacterized protein LOC105969713 [Erythranthe guttata]